MKQLSVINSLFSVNKNERLVLEKPRASLQKSNVVSACFTKYPLETVNKILAQTKFILINPNSADIEVIPQMVNKVHQREFIPVFHADDCSEQNFKSLSFGVYEASNPEGDEQFIFVYLSNLTNPMDIEDELEKRNIYGDAVLHVMTDIFAVHAGKNHGIVYTVDMDNAQTHFKQITQKND